MSTETIETQYNGEVEIEIGKTVVGFKSDFEQYGVVIAVTENYWGGYKLTIQNENGFEGEYTGGQTETVRDANDCWFE